MQLSPHFTLAELTVTLHRAIDNTAPPAIVGVLQQTTAPRMERIRAALGDHIVTVSSGYRCPALNAAVGGAPDSAHMSGYAVDFNVFALPSPLEVCKAICASGEAFDQLIEEGTWVHVSFDPRMRHQVLTKNPAGGYHAGLP